MPEQARCSGHVVYWNSRTMLARERWTVHEVCLLSLSRMSEDKISKLLSICPEYQQCGHAVQ